jgi:hypothetical protein
LEGPVGELGEGRLEGAQLGREVAYVIGSQGGLGFDRDDLGTVPRQDVNLDLSALEQTLGPGEGGLDLNTTTTEELDQVTLDQ